MKMQLFYKGWGKWLWVLMGATAIPLSGYYLPVKAQSSKVIKTSADSAVLSASEPHLAQTPPSPSDLLAPPQEPPPLPENPQPVPEPQLDLTPLPQVEPELQPEPEGPVPPLDTILVTEFEVRGSTVFSQSEFDQRLKEFTEEPISFGELLRARSVVTEMYLEAGYITTGAYIPGNQRLQGDGATVVIQVVEGRVEDIQISGTEQLSPEYVRSRLHLGTTTPLNQQRLLEALRLLQIDPLIDHISAELRAGVRPGTNVLEVQVDEANPFRGQIAANNGRSPSVGSFRRGATLTHANLLGIGDEFSASYNNTEGSDGFDLGYTIPLNPRNGSLSLQYSRSSTQIIDPQFEELDIESRSRYYQLTLRQPIIQSSSRELALGLTFSHSASRSFLEDEPIGLSPGADAEGRTRISALRFSQEWIQQGRRQVFALRSQFSLGINAFDATLNETEPDSQFFAWRGQLQWVSLLGPSLGTPAFAPTLLLRTDMQLADRPLVSVEQFGIGGLGSVRGYRQDLLLADNGFLASAEVRLPIIRIPEWQTAIQLIPFMEVGTGWNRGENRDLEQNTLVSLGLGLQLIQAQRFSARIDWGIPLTDIDRGGRTWQEDGIHFSIEFNPF